MHIIIFMSIAHFTVYVTTPSHSSIYKLHYPHFWQKWSQTGVYTMEGVTLMKKDIPGADLNSNLG